ncbi:MAG: WYL domain-containing protein [Candidatus Zixiibacteriota bacterium]|nr:MAG: WYL domain-containing protein [candidate division Zixibacteria bacterium]
MPQYSEYPGKQTFVAFDTETTGMWAPVNRIVELGAVKFNLADGRLGTYQSLVDPERAIPADVIEIHGITNEMVAGAPRIKTVLEEFASFCGKESIMIAHNAPFDISFMGSEMKRAGLDFTDNPILDTVDIYHRVFPGLESYSLLNIVRHFDVAVTQEHRALADAVLVHRLFEMAAKKFPPVSNRSDFLRLWLVHRISDWQGEPAVLPSGFEDLQNAVERGLRVEIDYQHPVKSPTTRVIQPHQVHQLGQVFYINAYCERARGERTFRLDRINNYRLLAE